MAGSDWVSQLYGTGSPTGGFNVQPIDYSSSPASPSIASQLNTGPSSGFNVQPIDYSSQAPSSSSIPSQMNVATNGNSTSPFWSWNGLADNPITHAGGSVLGFVGQKFDQFKHLTGLDHIQGAMQGVADPFIKQNANPTDAYAANPSHDMPFWQRALGALANAGISISNMANPQHAIQSWMKSGQALADAPQNAVQGFTNPDAANQKFQADLADRSPFTNFAANLVTDPMSYAPVGPAASLAAKGLKATADLNGITPGLDYAKNALLATKPGQVATNAASAVKDALASKFVRNYNTTPELANILDQGSGDIAAHQNNILNTARELQNSHGLTPDELNEIGHVIEGTIQGTPEQQSFANILSNLEKSGVQGSGIGSDLLAQTPSAVKNGEMLLPNQIPNHFSHIYDNVPDELKGVFPRKADGVSGLNPDGTYNQPRTYATLQDAINAGLKPELDPINVTATSLNRMSKAYVNNDILAKIKNTPGILFDKDPIDEAHKLVKTRGMSLDQAAQQVGLKADDFKHGFVRSEIPQLSGSYLRPADEAAIAEHLQPSRPTGFFGGVNKVTNLFNKGFLLSPIPHLRNVETNGSLLGGANQHYVDEVLHDISNGVTNPWHQQAIQAGAISNPVEGGFENALKAHTPSNPISAAVHAGHDLLWNTDSALRTSLFRQAKEAGMSDADAAARTNKFMVNYNNLTPFERKYIKPFIGFYAWKKGNIPLQVSQTFAQTPKYVAYDHAKNAISQALSGQPTNNNGRIMTGENFADGSHGALEFGSPMEDAAKIVDKGPLNYALGTINPAMREVIAQATSALGAADPKFGVKNQYPIYNAAAPASYNIYKGVSHALSGLDPFSGGAVSGELENQLSHNVLNKVFGVPMKDKTEVGNIPGINVPYYTSPGEILSKLVAGYTSRDNPAKDARNAQYDAKNNASDTIRYLKDTGQSIPKSLTRQAYRKVR